MKATKKLLSGIVAGSAFVGVAAQAHVLELTNFVGPGGVFHQGVNVSNPNYGGQAGGFVGTFDGSPIQVWCYEIGQTFSFGVTYDYTLGTPTHEGLLSALFQEAYSMATTSAMNSAAFQLAVWEIEYGSGLNLFATGGTFHTNRIGNATDALAQSWLDGLGAFSDKGDIILYHSPDHQDFIGRGVSTDAPEPGPLPLIGAGLVAMLVTSRRRGGIAARG